MSAYLSKADFLELVSIYYELDVCSDTTQQFLTVSKALLPHSDTLSHLCEYAVMFQYINANINSPEKAKDLKLLFTGLLNRLLDDYIFINSSNIPYAIIEKRDESDDREIITSEIAGMDATDADLIISEEELLTAANEAYPLDAMSYPRLFFEAKLEKVARGQAECVICGLSYTQHGIVEELMPCPTVNLSVSGQDIPYSLLLARKVIELSSKIRAIIVPIAYFMGFYDVSSDDYPMHEAMVGCIDIPLLGDKRNFTKEVYMDGYIKNTQVFDIYSRISDLTQFRKIRDDKVRKELMDKEFFNDMLAQSPTGGLKFDYHSLKGQDRDDSAAITEKLNRRVATYIGLEEVLNALESYAKYIDGKNIKTIFFVPPYTKELSMATDRNSRLRELFYLNVVPKIKSIPGAEFLDLCDSAEFSESDFVDFEHLDFYTGGRKLTKMLGELL